MSVVDLSPKMFCKQLKLKDTTGEKWQLTV